MLKVSKNLPILQNIMEDFIPENLKKEMTTNKDDFEKIEMTLKLIARDAMKV